MFHWERLGTFGNALIGRGASSLAGLGILMIQPSNAAMAGEQQLCGRSLKGNVPKGRWEYYII